MNQIERDWAPVIGAILAAIFLFFLVAACMIGYKALDDGPANRPSDWTNKR